MKVVWSLLQVGSGGAGALKRELTFPAECVEGAVPAPEKRRRLTRADVAPVDAWRIVMALKSGQLAETCWALDILNILLFDDNCIGELSPAVPRGILPRSLGTVV